MIAPLSKDQAGVEEVLGRGVRRSTAPWSTNARGRRGAGMTTIALLVSRFKRQDCSAAPQDGQIREPVPPDRGAPKWEDRIGYRSRWCVDGFSSRVAETSLAKCGACSTIHCRSWP
jgi:hypothetical protein